jgi:hypothetical protein
VANILQSLAQGVHITVTQRDLDTFIDPASRARIGAAAAQLTGADAVSQQIAQTRDTALLVIGGVVVLGLFVWYLNT